MYSEEVAARKRKMRDTMLTKREMIGAEEALRAGRAVILNLLSLPAIVKAQKSPQVMALFSPIRGEPDLLGNLELLTSAGFQMALPKMTGDRIHFYTYADGDMLENGRFSIPEPMIYQREVSAEQISVMCLPGLAYDRKGARLGYGKGFYDRFLMEHADALPLLLGISYDFQIVSEVSTEWNDCKMDYVITPSEVVDTHIQ